MDYHRYTYTHYKDDDQFILQISYGSSANILGTSRQLYRNHFQMYPSESTYLPAIADMIAYYGWSQLGIVTQNEDLFTGV